MKLFQKLIVAPAALGLLIPSAAFAEEIKLADISNYSSSKEVKSISDFDPAEEIAVTNSRVDGLESRFNDFEAGGFSETTTMKGKAEFQIGAGENAGDTEEALMFSYHYEVDLNSSFTGEDNLNVEFAAGNATGVNTVNGITGFGEAQDALTIEDVNYSFPLAEWEVSVGDSMDLSKNFPNACKLGTIVDNMDDCGAANAVDPGGDVSVSFGREFADGWAFGIGFSGDSGLNGLGTNESTDGMGAALGYENETYGLTFGYAIADGGAAANSDTTFYGATAYYSPEGMGTLSGGVELGATEGPNADTSQFKVGYSTDLGVGTFEVGFGTNGATDDGANEQYAYEASYSWPVNDSVSMTGFGYIAEVDNADDTSGIGVTTVFKF